MKRLTIESPDREIPPRSCAWGAHLLLALDLSKRGW